ncbi:MAG: glycosyltransferase 87 family protein [Myxococcales bacterium]|nr:glycosyltransferase 87 family protein [Polyangiaceae bacterium]MDW8250681.1 glycosyltransferase 87 family protein [Myxococcales bacterium]
MKRIFPALVGILGGTMLVGGLVLGLNPPLSDVRLQHLRIIFAAALIWLGAQASRRSISSASKVMQGATAATCVLGGALYFLLLPPWDSRIFKPHDIFHYYLGGKYQRELSYQHLYACTAQAQVELGQVEEVRGRIIRVLGTAQLVRGDEILTTSATTCRARFQEERWRNFVEDIRILREHIPLETWNEIQMDHGYNPPPSWALLGSTLASLHRPTRGYLSLLTGIDLLFLVGVGVATFWGFGPRVLMLLVAFLSCQEPGQVGWLGGSFLRLDWLFLSALGVAALARRKYGLAGASLAGAAAIRILPLFLMLGPLLVFGRRILQRNKAEGARKFLVGATLAGGIFLAGSAAVFGPNSWVEFAHHIQAHRAQTSLNRVGFPVLLQHDFSGEHHGGPDDSQPDRWARWRERKLTQGQRLWPLQALAVLGALMVVWRSRHRPPWVAAVSGLPLLATALSLSCYYWILLILVAPLARLLPRLERVILGSVIAGALLAVMPAFSSTMDHLYTSQSAVYLAMLALISACLWSPSQRSFTAPPRELQVRS